MLHIAEMEQVITTFRLDRKEEIRLRAAVLATSQMERVECAQQARISFMAALAELDKAALMLKASDAWLVWHDEAQNGLTAAQNRLASLGA